MGEGPKTGGPITLQKNELKNAEEQNKKRNENAAIQLKDKVIGDSHVFYRTDGKFYQIVTIVYREEVEKESEAAMEKAQRVVMAQKGLLPWPFGGENDG